MKSLTQENIPCWYELSFLPEKKTIILRIYKNYIYGLKRLTCRIDELPMFKFFNSKEKFKSDFNSDFGFGEVFKLRSKTDLFSEFAIEIPKIVKNPELIHLTVLTFSATFQLLNFQPEYSNVKTMQLMEISTFVESKTFNARAMSGSFSPVFVRWLEGFEIGHNFLRVIEAMISVHDLFYKTEKYERHEFKARIGGIKKGYLILGCPGTNCCQINPCGSWDEDEGYDFGYHNIDYSHQQLTLLAGLSFLHDEARKAGV
mgnify:CR=1 FL=1